VTARGPSRWKAIREHLRWRSPFIVAVLVFREICRPIFYWHAWHIYESNISRGVSQPYAKDGFTTQIHDGQSNRAALTSMLAAMGELASDEIRSRITRGHVAAVAYSGNEPVGYIWLAFSGGADLWFGYDTYWKLNANEAMRYGSFVVPAFRGQAIHSLLNSAINTYARERGMVRSLGAVSVLNRQSLSLAKHYRRAITMTVVLARIRGVNWTIRKSFGAPMESRFWWCKPEARSKESAATG
jgi:GNAT superfamily N-acetyltransferase